jgi:uncharacterized membrane protein YvlD (DUF360 family)
VDESEEHTYGESISWAPEDLKVRPLRFLAGWLVSALSLLVAAWIVPGVHANDFKLTLVVAAAVAILNAVFPPLVASLRLPFTLVFGFLCVLLLDAGMLMLASRAFEPDFEVDGFFPALVTALIASAVAIAIDVLTGLNDDDTHTLRVTQRVAKRQGSTTRTDVPGIIFLEIDGLAEPVLTRAIRDGHAPTMARWIRDGSHDLTGWEPDLSSQTGASQAGILLGSNEDIPAFRWVEKETGRMMTCSKPDDCAELERRHASGIGLLRDGGASRGNLLSGEADEVILTVSRMEEEKKANPGYRAFFSNGYNATGVLVLFGWEVILELLAAGRQKRRDVVPRGHRGFMYALMRGGLCVVVRDLIVYGVLTDMMAGRPAMYATFSSYDEVAHHSGLEREDTMEALRKLDQHFARIDRARRFAPRPYEIVVLSDHGQTQGATFLQRNGYGLDALVERSLSSGEVAGLLAGDENSAKVGQAFDEATGGYEADTKGPETPTKDVIVMGSGNLGLVYLMKEKRRLTMEEIDERHPKLLPALREHPHVGWVLVRSAQHGAVALGGSGTHYLTEGRVEGEDPLAHFSPNAARHLLRTDGFAHVADIMVGSFFDPTLEEGCAFEELISFHGGLGGPQTEPFILYPTRFPRPAEPIVGAAEVNRVLREWRAHVQSVETPAAAASAGA